MSTASIPVEPAPPAEPGSRLVKLYVWEWPVRLAHWAMVLSLAVLAFTGYYMHAPFLVAHTSTDYWMGTMRFIHEMAAWLLIAALLVRFYWFAAGNRWARLRAYVPRTRRQWRSLREMVTYYAFLRPEPFKQAGHNTLASVTYLAIYLLLVVECLIGLALYSAVLGNRVLSWFIGWLPRLIEIQYLRTAHYLLMFVFAAFLVQHLYSALLVSRVEKNGIMESIFSGYKFIPAQLAEEEIDEEAAQRGGKKL